MKLIHKLLNYSQPWSLPNIYLFTGNPVIKNNGAIVMGRGAAKQVRDSYPGVDLAFGIKLIEKPLAPLVWVTLFSQMHLGWFKVKYHWRDDAELSVIAESSIQLGTIAIQRPQYTFHMNYPGIGNGNLRLDDVQNVLNTLPDNVWIYK
jgi:hypothetical protein